MSPSVPAPPVILTVPEGDWSNLELPEHLRRYAAPDLDPSFRGLSVAGAGICDAWPRPAPAEPCNRTWKVSACECRARVYESGCCRLDCLACESHLRARRSAAFRDRIEPTRGVKPLHYTIFTVPPSLRAQAADPNLWSSWRRRIWKYLKKKHGGLFAVERTDPAGDSDKSLWHPHLNFLWIQRDGFRPHLDLDAIRAEWARIIGYAGKVDFHHEYSTNERKIGFWYWYQSRTWADWQGSVKKHLTIRWLGSYPKKPEKETCCPDCGSSFVSLYCGSRDAAESLAALGPAAVRWEAEKLEMAKAFRQSDRSGSL